MTTTTTNKEHSQKQMSITPGHETDTNTTNAALSPEPLFGRVLGHEARHYTDAGSLDLCWLYGNTAITFNISHTR